MAFVRPLLLVFFTWCCLGGTALADTARTLWDGSGSGGIHVPGAEVMPGQGSVTAWGSWFRQGDLLTAGDTADRLQYGLGAMYAPKELNRLDEWGVEIGVSVGGSRARNDRGNPDQLASFGDFELSSKGMYRIHENVSAGVRGRLILPHGVTGHSGYGDTASYAGEALATWRSGDFATHLATGFLYDRTINLVPRSPSAIERFAWQQTDFNQVLVGLSANYEQDRLDYILEFSGEIPVGGGAPGLAAAPVRLTPGIRARPWGPVEVQIAVDIGLSAQEAEGLPAQPHYDVLAGVRWLLGAPQDRPEPVHPEPVEADPEPEPQPEPTPEPAPEPEPLEEFGALPGLPEADEAEPEAPEVEEAPPSPEMELTDPTLGSITGRVSEATTGAPVADATVTVFPDGIEAATDAQGVFFVADLEPGTRLLRVERDGYASGTATPDVEAGETLSLELSIESLVQPATVVLEVVDAQGDPIADAEVRLGGQRQGQTDASGSLTLDGIETAEIELTILREGYHELTRRLVVEPGEQREENLALEPLPKPGYLDIRVMGPERNPIEAMVSIEGQPQSARRLDPAGGSTTLYRLDPGSYRIRIEAEGHVPEVREVEILEDGEAAMNVRMESR